MSTQNLVENIIKTAPISIDDNYKLRLEKRLKVLCVRREKLNLCRCCGFIEYDNSMAVRFYPAIKYRKDFKRLNKMISEIDKETRLIYKYL